MLKASSSADIQRIHEPPGPIIQKAPGIPDDGILSSCRLVGAAKGGYASSIISYFNTIDAALRNMACA
ncbi:MAG: hypothetical protein N2515_01445, partial [Deltaproteobacteria bacterium]|nr:hypothetical protein [Deltaproteobacteria bacterium]